MAEPKAFTPRELEIMGMAWLCFPEQPKPDYDKLAGLCGFTNPKSAANAWSNIKKKLVFLAENSTGDDDDGGVAANLKTPSKATPRKRGKISAAEDDDSPAKKAKGRKGKAQSAPLKDSFDEYMDQKDETIVATVKEEEEQQQTSGEED